MWWKVTQAQLADADPRLRIEMLANDIVKVTTRDGMSMVGMIIPAKPSVPIDSVRMRLQSGEIVSTRLEDVAEVKQHAQGQYVLTDCQGHVKSFVVGPYGGLCDIQESPAMVRASPDGFSNALAGQHVMAFEDFDAEFGAYVVRL